MSAATGDAYGFGNGKTEHPWQWAPATVVSYPHMAKSTQEAVVEGDSFSDICSFFFLSLNKSEFTVLGDILSLQGKKKKDH